MSTSESPPAPPKPSASPFWKWLIRITGTIALLLFLTPTFYVIKYYAVDLPRETALVQPRLMHWRSDPDNPDDLLAEAQTARSKPVQTYNPEQAYRVAAIHAMGETLRRPGVNWQRPLECLSAKATLAELATKDADPAVKAAASQELGKIAQAGAVIRR